MDSHANNLNPPQIDTSKLASRGLWQNAPDLSELPSEHLDKVKNILVLNHAAGQAQNGLGASIESLAAGAAAAKTVTLSFDGSEAFSVDGKPAGSGAASLCEALRSCIRATKAEGFRAVLVARGLDRATPAQENVVLSFIPLPFLANDPAQAADGFIGVVEGGPGARELSLSLVGRCDLFEFQQPPASKLKM